MNKKILIIDDNKEICELYKKTFELANYNIKIENDGLKGIIAAVEFKPDIIILDIMMPTTDGYEVLKVIKNQTNLGTKIIINSNLTGKNPEQTAINLGADKYLRKSDYSPNDVLNFVEKIFNKETNKQTIKKIMIIDDNEEICEMYKIALDQNGYDVKVEYNGLNGLTTALDYQPDLIILDIMMPQTNGYEVLESIVSHTDLDSIIIVNSNLSSLEDEKKALDLGATKFLRKADYTPIEVISLIKNIKKD